MTKNIVNRIDFMAAEVVQYQEIIKQKEWVYWGSDNYFPNHLLALYQNSPIHRACANAISYGVNFRVRSASSTSQQFKIWFSTNFVVTWTLWTTSTLPLSVYPAWDAYGGLSFFGGQTIYFALTDLSAALSGN
jgi:hypothetical protein